MAKVVVSDKICASDAFWWRADKPWNPMVVDLLLGIKGTISLAELRDLLKPQVVGNIRMQSTIASSRVGAFRPLLLTTLIVAALLAVFLKCCTCTILILGLVVGCYLESAYGCRLYFQRLKDFSVEDYVKVHALEEPTDDCLYKFVNEQVSQQLPKDRAQWVVFVLTNTPDGNTKIFFRFHHLLADGTGLGGWFYMLCSTPEQRELDWEKLKAIVKERLGPKPRKAGLARVKAAIDNVLVQWLLFVFGLGKLLLLPRDSNCPLKGPNTGRRTPAAMCPALQFKVDEVKAVGKRVDPSITVNDTMCAVLAGAFARYFQSLQLHPEQMVMRVTMPVNARRNPLAPITMHNDFTLVFKSLPIHLATPEERISHFHVRMGLLKRGYEPLISMMLQKLLTFMPDAVYEAVVFRYTIVSSMVLTNVLCALYPYHMCGKEIGSVDFWVPCSGDLGCGVSIATYCNDIHINLVADSNLVPDWAPITKLIEEEWSEMKKRFTTQDLVKDSAEIPTTPGGVLALYAKFGFPLNTR